MRLQLDDLSDVGVANLICELITTAKADFFRAYENVRQCRRTIPDPDDYSRRQAEHHYERAKRFFYSDIFSLASPVSGDDYIKYLIEEYKRGHVSY